jgi:hypothetical protein
LRPSAETRAEVADGAPVDVEPEVAAAEDGRARPAPREDPLDTLGLKSVVPTSLPFIPLLLRRLRRLA